MSLSRFKFTIFITFTLVFLISFMTRSEAAGIFAPEQCLESQFSIDVSHKGAPFGLSENILSLSKDKCIIKIEHERLRFMQRSWEIDICREPIHIKKGVRSVSVLQRKVSCLDSGAEDEFCDESNLLLTLLQDDGLIFAEGERETLDTDHGKVYCSYLLLQRYLLDGHVFSRSRMDDLCLDRPCQRPSRRNLEREVDRGFERAPRREQRNGLRERRQLRERTPLLDTNDEGAESSKGEEKEDRLEPSSTGSF